MSFLNLENKNILVMGVANRKSVAWHVGEALTEAGAKVIYSVQNEEARVRLEKLLPGAPLVVCDVERPEELEKLADQVGALARPLHGLVHSLAFANYSEGLKPFHETRRDDFLQAVNISCFSLTAAANALKDLFDPDASVVTISISTTTMASESYGYMGPIKAALDSSLCFLAKSFSAFSRVRFNAVRAGLLKTSASAGIPGYIDNYLYAESLTLRRQAVQTREAANAVVFLLSPAASGVNATGIVVDAGMAVNYFDREIVRRAMRPE